MFISVFPKIVRFMKWRGEDTSCMADNYGKNTDTLIKFKRYSFIINTSDLAKCFTAAHK
jgi:hypothetical protein